MIKLGIIREGKNPPDNRVPLTPLQCREVQEKFPEVEVIVQSSKVRCFSDNEYRNAGIKVREEMNSCSVLMGIKEVRVEDLISGKTYFCFSHTIKKQEYNRKLLQTILKKKIRLIDYEVITDEDGNRIIGFGHFAGLVGAYSGIRAWGLRNGFFRLKPAWKCQGLNELYEQLKTLKIPPVKIVITGAGRVAGGSMDILNFLNLKQLSPGLFLETEAPGEPVFAQLRPRDYARRKDGNTFIPQHFFRYPEMYENAFLPYTYSSDMLIAAAYWDPKSPVLFTAEDMRNPNFRFEVISDITCDIEGAIPSTKRASHIQEPYYDYNPVTEQLEPPFSSPRNITVQAVDNLPNELPEDASEDFGRTLIDEVFPSLFGKDNNGIIQKATITSEGKLTPLFSYLENFVSGKEI